MKFNLLKDKSMDQYISAGIRIKLTLISSSLEAETLPFSLYSRRWTLSSMMRSTHPIVPLDGLLVTLTKSPAEKSLWTLNQEMASTPSSVARSTYKWAELITAIVAAFFPDSEKTMTCLPSSKIHSLGQGNLDQVRAGCNKDLNNPNIQLGIPAKLGEIKWKSNFSWSSPWSKMSLREV